MRILKTYLSAMNHLEQVRLTLGSLNNGEIDHFSTSFIKKILSGQQLFVMGNGGSHAIAQHLATDIIKVGIDHNFQFNVVTLGCNTSLLSALSNDLGYSRALLEEYKSYGNTNSTILVISSSGNSENVNSVALEGKKAGSAIFALTGFSGAQLSSISDFAINLNLSPGMYEVAEDVHGVICHTLAKVLRSQIGLQI